MEIYNIPTIYCINLKKSTKRRKRMEKRFKYHGLFDKVIFIDAIHGTSNLINFYHQKLIEQPLNQQKWKNEMGCYASHLKAIKTFLETTENECLICEDDIILHNDFKKKYADVRSNFPPNTTCVGLSYMIEKWENYDWCGLNINKYNLRKLNKNYTWGMQMYWISKAYAIEVLTLYDKPYYLTNDIHTSEVILRNSNGYIAYPVLAIEESIDSERGAPEDLPYHRNHFSAWGYHNFNDVYDATMPVKFLYGANNVHIDVTNIVFLRFRTKNCIKFLRGKKEFNKFFSDPIIGARKELIVEIKDKTYSIDEYDEEEHTIIL